MWEKVHLKSGQPAYQYQIGLSPYLGALIKAWWRTTSVFHTFSNSRSGGRGGLSTEHHLLLNFHMWENSWWRAASCIAATLRTSSNIHPPMCSVKLGISSCTGRPDTMRRKYCANAAATLTNAWLERYRFRSTCRKLKSNTMWSKRRVKLHYLPES